MSDTQFPEGIFFKLPRSQAPDYVKGNLKIKLDEALPYLQDLKDSGEEWLSLNLMESKKGKGYASVDTWEPDPEKAKPEPTPQSPPPSKDLDDVESDLPF